MLEAQEIAGRGGAWVVQQAAAENDGETIQQRGESREAWLREFLWRLTVPFFPPCLLRLSLLLRLLCPRYHPAAVPEFLGD